MEHLLKTGFAANPTPPLKWAGGKRWLVPQLQDYWKAHSHRRLVEPFVGGMAVTLGLDPVTALLNDINMHLMNFYRWVREGLVIESDFQNSADYYYQARKQFNELISSGNHSSKEAAELFYYLNRTGYNGLCRFNKKGEFNVPFGRYKNPNYVEDFLGLQDILDQWELSVADFSDLELRDDDFIYADPPYDVEFTSYSPNAFSWEEQVRLINWLRIHNGPIIASNQATPRILDLYKTAGFNIEILDAPRRISSNGDRTPAKEMLAFKNL